VICNPRLQSCGSDRVSVLGPSVREPSWWNRGTQYYSIVRFDRRDSVEVYLPPSGGQLTNDSPGSLRLHLEASSKAMQVLDGGEQELGHIDVNVPKLVYTMRCEERFIWKLSVRSLVLRRHTVQFAADGRWLFYTPFFWWQSVLGVENDGPKVIGRVGPTKRIWLFRVAPESDQVPLLSLVAMLHRNWWRS